MSKLYRFTGTEPYRRSPRRENDPRLSLPGAGVYQIQPHDTVIYLRVENSRVFYRHLRSGYLFRTIDPVFYDRFEEVK